MTIYLFQRSFQNQLVDFAALELHLSLDFSSSQKLRNTVSVVSVETDWQSKVGEHFLFLRFYPNFGVTENQEKVVISDRLFVGFVQIVAFFVGQRNQHSGLCGGCFWCEASFRVAGQAVAIDESNYHYDLLMIVNLAMNVDWIEGVESVDQFGINYGEVPMIFNRLLQEELLFFHIYECFSLEQVFYQLKIVYGFYWSLFLSCFHYLFLWRYYFCTYHLKLIKFFHGMLLLHFFHLLVFVDGWTLKLFLLPWDVFLF